MERQQKARCSDKTTRAKTLVRSKSAQPIPEVASHGVPQFVSAAWPNIPVHVKEAITTLIDAALLFKGIEK